MLHMLATLMDAMRGNELHYLSIIVKSHNDYKPADKPYYVDKESFYSDTCSLIMNDYIVEALDNVHGRIEQIRGEIN